MKYTLTNKPQKINETKGEIQNVSVRHGIVLAAGTSIPSVDTSTITVRPGESYPFKTVLGEVLYAWIINANDDETLEVSVINFPSEGEGGDTDISAIETEIINQGKQIQNLSLLGVPGKPLVAGMDFRGDTPKFYGVLPQMANQLGLGDGTVFSDGSGMDGIIVRKNSDIEGSIQIGEGCENLTPFNWKDRVSSVGAIAVIAVEEEKVKVTIPSGTLMNSWFPVKISENLLLDEGKTNNIKSTLKIDVKSGNVSQIDLLKATFKFKNDADASMLGESENLSLGSKEYKIQADNINIANSLTYNGLGINCNNVGWTITEDIVFYISKVSSVQSDTEVPYIKKTAPAGRIVIEEPWTTDTHSFIKTGNKFQHYEGYNNVRMQMAGKKWEGNQEDIAINNSQFRANGGNMLASKDIVLGIMPDGSEVTGGVVFQGMSGGGIMLANGNRNKSLMYPLPNSFETYFVYEGILTEVELRAELAKVNSENFLLPDSGVVENIPYAKKKSDTYGNIKAHIEVDTTRDLGLLEEESMWEIIKLSDNTVSYASVTKVVDVWTITGALDNVSGMLRVQYPAKIRRM